MNPVTVERSWPRWALAAGLFVVTLLLFWRAVGHEFVNYDDPDYVTANPHVQAGLSAAGVRWALQSGEASNWHPLTWISHQIDASLFGKRAAGHHATSVVIHALNAVLAFLALRQLTGALWTSALFAALFAWHPLRVESVAWVAERKDVLSGFFWFATLWAYGIYAARRQRGERGARTRWPYAIALLACALGLIAKPMLVTLPCVLLLLDFWPLRRWVPAANPAGLPRESVSRLVVEKLPFFALAIASSVVTYHVQKDGGAVSVALSVPLRLENALVAVVSYLGKFIWPVDLAVLYPHPGEWPGRVVIWSGIIVVSATVLAVGLHRRRPWLTVGWLWFLGTLVPVIGLVQVGLQSMADRYTYLPMLGVQIALLWTVREWAATPGARRAWGAAAVALLGAAALRTHDQIGVWKNSFTLFDHAIAVTSRNYLAHDNRGLWLFNAGRVDEAMADYRRSLAINPDYLNAHNNLGYAFAQTGRPAEAIPEYRAALKSNPAHLEVRNNLANALSDLGQLPEAMEHYEFVLARRPDHVNALNGSAVALAMQNRLPEARTRLERSLQLAPDNVSALNNLGNVCAMLGQREDAIRHYRRAAALNPAEAHALVLAGSLLNELQRFAEAVEVLQTALQRAPAQPEAHAQLGLACARLGRRDDAVRAWQTALQLKPDHPNVRAWLAALPAK
ncbi:tetratricopeptide repeat protein [Horticoccus sp. 23ND18S-11]|uniref:tetratricopeptide repeat protein n=1 Tax=Horticoccus sp. 23ND18S-11 TaxID=3391832 RepID=UPI0039C951AA